MDSGIGTEVTTTSMPSTAPIHGGIGRTASDLPRATVQQQQQQVQQQHSSIGPTRSQSMKVNFIFEKYLVQYLKLKKMFIFEFGLKII